MRERLNLLGRTCILSEFYKKISSISVSIYLMCMRTSKNKAFSIQNIVNDILNFFLIKENKNSFINIETHPRNV